MTALVLVLDQGGHSSRALVFDANGKVVAQANHPVSTVYPQSGYVEQDPVEILDSLRIVLAAVASQLGRHCPAICAAALIVQRSSLLAWDKASGQILSPILSWQDTRNGAWLDSILRGERDSLRKLTGLYANAHYGASKMRWLLDNDQVVQAVVTRGSLCIAPLASYLQQQLTGEKLPVVDAVIASRTMLTELGAGEWSAALLDFFGIPAAVLPVIKPTLADYGMLHIDDCNVPLRLLGGDQSFFALAHRQIAETGTVFINAGTGAFLQVLMPAHAVPHCLLAAPLMIAANSRDHVIVAEGTVNAAATALSWFWRHAGCDSFDSPSWDSAAEQACSAHVPLFCNRVTATGSPDWLPAGESFFSCAASVQLQAIAVLESIVFSLQRNLDCMCSASVVLAAKPRQIVLSGGLSQIRLFCQRLADISQLSVLISHDAEACARGAAMQLLPEMTGEQERHVIRPQPDIALQDRYRRWTLMMDQLAVAAG